MPRMTGLFRCLRRFDVGLALLIGVVVTAPRIRAQFPTAPDARIAFDVVSIKPALPPPTSPGGVPLAVARMYQFRGGRYRHQYATVKALIITAFRIKPSQIVGGPDWIDTAQFEIVATLSDKNVPPSTFGEQLPALLRPLLEDRFSLKTHTERRPFPVYALIKARKDGGLGAHLRPSVTDCQSVVCGSRSGAIWTRKVTMARLADILMTYTDRPVLDRTDLMDSFDIDLEWAPGTRIGLGINAPIDAVSVTDGPSLFTAIQEQLGLKLEPRDEPMDLLVVDHVSQPTPN